jgi:hypothetical protein
LTSTSECFISLSANNAFNDGDSAFSINSVDDYSLFNRL